MTDDEKLKKIKKLTDSIKSVGFYSSLADRLEAILNDDPSATGLYNHRRIYLSGPMTDIEEYNYPLFNKIASEYRVKGYLVSNPAEFFGGKGDRTREEYMRLSIIVLLKCDEILMLPGWEASKGAQLEKLIAEELELKVFYYQE